MTIKKTRDTSGEHGNRKEKQEVCSGGKFVT